MEEDDDTETQTAEVTDEELEGVAGGAQIHISGDGNESNSATLDDYRR